MNKDDSNCVVCFCAIGSVALEGGVFVDEGENGAGYPQCHSDL